ncbi:hypothetical protein [Halorubellus salinus]|uniref:hypothetical protein n=1 Tax=Halorubellus salinus TaxID=755309 RepID=UPI001D07B5ED|nr:hypothetical protein [Halorubellus salinus]
MGGKGPSDDPLHVGWESNVVDDLGIECSRMLADLDVEHVFVAGYLAILTRRTRLMEDVDVIVEPYATARTSPFPSSVTVSASSSIAR